MQVATEDLVSASGERGGFVSAELRGIQARSLAGDTADGGGDRQIALLTLAGAGALTLAWTGLLVWSVIRAAQWVMH
jgi:hypothetical protein